MVNDQMPVSVQLVLSVIAFDIDVIAGVVLAAFLGDGKKDGIVVYLGTKLVIPLLDEQDTGFGAGVA
jgi:hypothetical protein